MDSDSDTDGSHVSATPPGSPLCTLSSRQLPPGAESSIKVLSPKKTHKALSTLPSEENPELALPHLAPPSSPLQFRICSLRDIQTQKLEILPAGYFMQPAHFSNLGKRKVSVEFDSPMKNESNSIPNMERGKTKTKKKVAIPNLIGEGDCNPKKPKSSKGRGSDGNFVKMQYGKKKFRNIGKTKKNGYTKSKKKFIKRG